MRMPMAKGRHARRVAVIALWMGCAAGLLLGWTLPAQARQDDTQATLFVGTTRFESDDATSYGSTFGGSFGYELIDDLLWNIGLSATTTDGTKTVANKTYQIHANTTDVTTGPTFYFNRTPTSIVIPYIGAGISYLSYDVDYTFPGSELGKISGGSPGAYALAGVELWITRSVTLISQYTVAEHEIKSQTGSNVILRSGGLALSLRFGIRI